MSSIKEAISAVVSGKDLAEDEASLVMEEMMSGLATQGQIGAFLAALRMKGETVEEITAFARKMCEKAIRISPKIQGHNFSGKLTDTCGTGGDRIKTFNISTISALVVSGAGIPVAKHGNRSVTSMCGSADLLERLGVNIEASPSVVERSIETCGIGFMLASTFHPAMKKVGDVRREIGIRTVFNILGPLTNPARAEAQLVGVYEDGLVRTIAEVLKRLGLKNAMVIHGLDGLDEVSVIGMTHVARLHEDGTIVEKVISPSEFGLGLRSYEEITAQDKNIDEHAALAVRVLSPDHGERLPSEDAIFDMVLANSSAALVLAGKVDNFLDGVEEARESIRSGRALEKLLSLIECLDGNLGIPESILSRQFDDRGL